MKIKKTVRDSFAEFSGIAIKEFKLKAKLPMSSLFKHIKQI